MIKQNLPRRSSSLCLGSRQGFGHTSTTTPHRHRVPFIRASLVEPGSTVLVAGATGGVGQLLCAKLLDRGYKVKAMTRNQEKYRQILGDAPNFEVTYGDMRDVSTLPAAVHGVDAICCCTGTTAFPSKRWDGNNGPEQTDYVGVKNLIEATPNSINRFVLTTSAGVERYDQFPFFILNAFGVLKYKRMSEQLLEQSGIPYTIVRPNRLTDGPYTSYDLNTVLQGISGTRQDIILSLKDDQVGETSRIAVAEAIVQALMLESTEGKAYAVTSKEGDGPGEDATSMVEEETEGRYGLRKRRKGHRHDDKSLGMSRLLAAFDEAKRILIFSGSGLSATSGMSTFSTKGGLYERAQRKFKLADGKNLFTYTFFDRNRTAAQAFFADIYLEATQAKPAPGHHALSDLSASGYMQRHYTLNIDGLAERVGIDTWHPDHNPNGTTVEMHGNIHFLVCVECGYQVKIDPTSLLLLQKEECIPCPECQEERTDLRFKVMMYEDAESEAITPESVMDLMEADAKAADLILWIGISFQQSASTSYFRKVRHWLQEESRLESVVQVIVNPSDESLWNLMTACSNQHELNVVEVQASADEVLPALVEHVERKRRQQQQQQHIAQ